MKRESNGMRVARTVRATLALALWAPVLGTATLGAPAARAASLEETVAVERGGTLRVELDVGTVDVESHDAETVEIDADGEGFGIEFDLAQHGDELILSGTSEGGWWQLFRGGEVRVRARVPREFSLVVATRGGRVDVEQLQGRVDAHTTGGNIDIDRVVGPVRVRTTGGSIDATEIRGDVDAETTGGTIRIEEVRGDVGARTAGGSIRVEDVTGKVDAETTGGSLRVTWQGPAEGSLRTTGGSIHVEVPEGSGARLRARTVGGGVDIDDELPFSGPREHTRADGELAGGGAPLELRTTGGGISIRLR